MATGSTDVPPFVEPAPATDVFRQRRPPIPKLVLALRNYSFRTLTADLTAGLTVGLVALPLAMAFAISSGLPPESGIYCAIVTGFLISALGGSMVQIGGPTGAFVVVVSGIVAEYGVDGLFMCTMMGGVMLVILGATGMGSAISFIPRPVVVGFTNGIAIIIASTQIRDFFGLTVSEMPGEFAHRMATLAQAAPTISWPTTVLSAGTLAVLIFCQVKKTRVPGTIVALFGGTIAAALFGLPVDTIDSRFKGIPSGLPDFQIPTFRADLVVSLLTPAFTVAMLGGIESLMSAVVADRMSGDRHNPNVELMAQGVANIASPLFGGLPATGALARTATNIRSGAKTPVAGITHALTLLLVILFAAPLAGYIPMPVLAAILMMVAWNMGDWGEIPDVFRMSRTDISVWLVTFVLTVFADLTQAVEVGMALAALLFIRRVATTTDVAQVTDEFIARTRSDMLQDKPIPPYVAVFRVTGPLLFGSTDKLDVVRDRLDSLPPIVILRLRYMTAIDATGLRAIEDLSSTVRQSNRVFLVSGPREQPYALMKKARFDEHIGPENLCRTYDDALVRAQEIYEQRFSGAWPMIEPPKEPETVAHR
ncbi:MAG TPA: SulP family inorganic anion transporter [Vicinamibacterales bacterium]